MYKPKVKKLSGKMLKVQILQLNLIMGQILELITDLQMTD